MLLLCGLVFWNIVFLERQRAMDADVRGFLERHAMRIHSPRERERFSEVLESFYGENGQDSLLYFVRDDRGQTLLKSPIWPEELDSAALVYDPSRAPEPEPMDPLMNPPPGRPENWETMRPLQRNRRPLGPGRRFRDPQGPPEFDPVMGPRDGSDPDRSPPFRRRGRMQFQMDPPIIQTYRTGDDEWRIGILKTEDLTFAFGVNQERFNEEINRMRNRIFLSFGAALGLIGLGGWFIAAKAIRPLRQIRATAETMTVRGLDQRIPDKNEDREISALIQVLNQMMERLERSFHQAIRFSADASHELKTPLTIMQGELEAALQHSPPGSEQQQLLTNLLDETQRLKSITRSLLLLSQADAGQLKLNVETVDLSQLAEEVLEDASILAEELRLEIRHRIDPDCRTAADPALMKTVLNNLVSNAAKYNQEEGNIDIELVRAGSVCRFRIANSGPGIPEDMRDKVFERFYRIDSARSRNVDGFGLGLSLSMEILRAHDSRLILLDSAEGQTCFEFSLPWAADDSDRARSH